MDIRRDASRPIMLGVGVWKLHECGFATELQGVASPAGSAIPSGAAGVATSSRDLKC
jgi:hypothetical protein